MQNNQQPPKMDAEKIKEIKAKLIEKDKAVNDGKIIKK